MNGCTLAQETEMIGKELDECSHNNNCSECEEYDCPINPNRYEEDPYE